MKPSVAAAIVAAFCVFACGHPATKPEAAPHKAEAPLLVTVTVANGQASLEIVNRGSGAVSIASQSLDSATLILEVRDVHGRVVPPVPPPTPTGAIRYLAAGERLRRTLSLDVFSPPLPAGDYTVRATGPDIESTVASLHVSR